MARIRIIKDAYDEDTVHVYTPLRDLSSGQRIRWICWCSPHVDAVADLFGNDVDSKLQDQSEIDVRIKVEIDDD